MKNKASVRGYVCDKFFQYSGKETEEGLFPIIMEDFANGTNEVTLHDKDSEVGTYISVVNKEEYPYLTIHIDRVPLSAKPDFVVTKNTITSQLDNLISVAVAKFLFDSNFGYNFLFTTREERGGSPPQLRQYFDSINAKKIPIIDLDIDKIGGLFDIPNGEITLRKEDLFAKFNETLVNKLQTTAIKHEVPFLSNEKYPVHSQAGMLAKYTSYSGAFVGMPITNLHSGKETTDWRCVENAIKLLTLVQGAKNGDGRPGCIL